MLTCIVELAVVVVPSEWRSIHLLDADPTLEGDEDLHARTVAEGPPFGDDDRPRVAADQPHPESVVEPLRPAVVLEHRRVDDDVARYRRRTSSTAEAAANPFGRSTSSSYRSCASDQVVDRAPERRRRLVGARPPVIGTLT